MKKRLLSIMMVLALCLGLRPTVALAEDMPLEMGTTNEQFSLTPGGTYYFDLSGENILGTVNTSLPDTTLHYVPFTYAGTVDAYKLTSEKATTENYAEKYKYAHSLFVADYSITQMVSWNDLNTESLIFGKDYTSGGVDYTLRAPSAGSMQSTDKSGAPVSNEWDTMLNKDDGYIQNWDSMLSWGQDTYTHDASYRIDRGYHSTRHWNFNPASYQRKFIGFRPVLEVLNVNTLGSDGLKAVTLDLNGGKLGSGSDDIQIIVKNDTAFPAPTSDSLTAPMGYNASGFKWRDDNGNLYAPGDSVPAGVAALTAQFSPNTYTVTLRTNGGTIGRGNVTEYTYGVGAMLPTDVTRTGYTFEGWYASEDLTGDPVTAIDTDETDTKEYWARWTADTYTVTLRTNGGTVNSGNVAEYTYGVGAVLPTDVTRTGYTFEGWYASEDLTGDPVTAIGTDETDTKEYWARWTVDTYTVALNPNGGTVGSGNVTEYTYGVGAVLPTDVTRAGYIFAGWYANEALTGDPITAIGTDETDKKEYWAKWVHMDISAPSGWKELASGTVYYKNGLKVKGLQKIGGKTYYFNEKGYLQTGWVELDGSWYYFDSDMQTGWQKLGGCWYFLDPDTGVMAENSWVLSKGVWYYLGESGAMLENQWVQWNGAWYYLGEGGAMLQSRWLLWNGAWYYLSEGGTMLQSR